MPNASGLAIMPRFSARTEALRAYTPRDLTLHRADGSPVPTRTISLQDCEELRRLADEVPLSGPAPDAEPSEPWRSERPPRVG